MPFTESLEDASPRVNKNADVPRHTQVKEILRDLVTSGKYQPGDKIPAELQLADLLGVSKMTVNKAVLALAADGLLIREVGRGTFVAPPMTPSLPHPKSQEVAEGHRKIALSFVDGARDVFGSSYYGGIYRGVAAYLEEAAERAEISLSPIDADAERSFVDGRLIFAPRAESIATIESLWAKNNPLVVVGASWPNLNAPAVDSDNTGGAFTAVRYLLEQGHRRIVLLFAEAETANTQDRIAGYRRALALQGTAYRAEYEVRAEAAWKAGASAEEKLVALLCDTQEPVTAIFAAGHYLALEAFNACRIAGKQIPTDVSVIGYDDATAADLIHPRLTVMRQPLFEMGRRAAERLLRLMGAPDAEREGPVVRELLPAELIVRESVAMAKVG